MENSTSHFVETYRAQQLLLLQGDAGELHAFDSKQDYSAEILPILSVTVMMLRDIVDSVIVLNDEHCKRNS